jgi:hypothetical protein
VPDGPLIPLNQARPDCTYVCRSARSGVRIVSGRFGLAASVQRFDEHAAIRRGTADGQVSVSSSEPGYRAGATMIRPVLVSQFAIPSATWERLDKSRFVVSMPGAVGARSWGSSLRAF